MRCDIPAPIAPSRACGTGIVLRMSTLEHLQTVVSAHPGLLLEDDERETFGAEIPDLEGVLRDHPDDEEARVYVAYAHRKLGRFAEAHATIDPALATERSWRAVTVKASIHRAAGKTDEAVALFDEASKLDTEDTAALMEGARTFGEAERFAEAATWFGRVVERDPDHTDALLWGEYSAHCATGDAKHVARVRAFLEEEPDDELAERLLGLMEG